MTSPRVALSRVVGLLRRGRVDADLDADVRAHLDLLAAEHVARGMSPADAERAARRDFGGVEAMKDAYRDQRGLPFLESLVQDIRHGLRTMRKTPVWTAVMAMTLALGVGLSTAIFSVVYGVLLAPLPYAHPDRLVALWSSAPLNGYQRFNVNAFDWITWRAHAHSFDDIALARLIANYNLTGNGPPERLQGARTSSNLFEVLGVQPAIGRVFTRDEQASGANVAVLSYGLWQRRFGGDPSIVGRTIQLNGQAYEAIGVMPRGWVYPTPQFELWTPLFLPPDEIAAGLNNDYAAVGRLKAGITLSTAQAEMSTIMRGVWRRFPVPAGPKLQDGGFVDVVLQPLLTSDTLQIRTALWVLLAAVSGLVAIGALNLGVLFLARASARMHEFAVRAALGASVGRLKRQMLAETMPLAAVGSVGGCLLALSLLNGFRVMMAAQIPRIESVGLSAPVLAFAVAVSLCVVVLAALTSMRAAHTIRRGGGLRAGARVTDSTRVRSVLVAVQVAIALVLLFAATLFARSLAGVLAVDPGFTTEGVLTMHLAVTRQTRPQDAQISGYYDRIIERLRGVPGVIDAGFVNRLPFSGIEQVGPVQVEGRRDAASLISTDWRSATAGYFRAVGIPLVRGRLFNAFDRPESPPVVLLDEQLAKNAFGDESPLGKRIRIPVGDQPWCEIVGVVGHIRNATPEQDYRPQVYWPESQRTQDRAALVVRTAGKPDDFSAAVIEQIHKEDPDQPVYDVRAMDEWLARAISTRTLTTWLVVFFGGAALLLAALGIYGVISYASNLRTREFGIRLALGGTPAHIRRLVLSQSFKVVIAGCAAGFALMAPAGRALRGLLFGISGSDETSLLIAPALLLAVALLASAGPLRRAAGVDPAVTLRAE